jgi:crotonobetainyl-CoA:carnitine CoA-transferase CaiB-like acyl-CoA transferase
LVKDISQQASSQSGPLEGILVLDLTDEKGMYMSKLLADMGARVILIEHPSGHPARHIGPFYNDTPDPNRSLLFWYHSTNKESITLDIETQRGGQLFCELAKNADVVLESYQPGYLDSIGLGYQDLYDINPRLIMTSLTGFGQTGPYRDFKTSDLVAMAMGGPMASCGYDDIEGSPPIRSDGWMGYSTGCNFGAIGTMTALFHREFTGEGQWVDVSIHESLSCTTEAAMPYWFFNRQTPIRQTGRHHGLSPTKPIQYETSDDKLINGFDIPPRSIDRWNSLIQWMNEKGMAEDFGNDSYRQLIIDGVRTGPDIDRLKEHIAHFIGSQTGNEAYHKAQQIRLAWGLIRSPEETLEDENFRYDRGFFSEITHPELGSSFIYPGAPYLFNKTPWNIRRRAPLLAEDNERIYINDLELSREDLSDLRESKVI